ncbi:beta-N-acetylhexosaminidase [Cohnella nanjingensis]|uniref:beta-N-acetylhexosaminidase n=2 Tax=Cohnella nanjingensis TaxID=1387779 RepID=A0A7X0RVE3_9BACL|nr:beta-N-acetylhexosaminidase [Cohnella nanjingensis]
MILLGTAAIAALSGCGGTGGSSGSPAASPTAQAPSSTAPSGTIPATPSPGLTESPPPASSPTSGETSGDLIRDKIAGMTLEEKVGQMILVGFEGKQSLDAETLRMIQQDHVGGVILYAPNVSDIKGTVALVNKLKKANTANPAPLFVSVDQEGGKVSRTPKDELVSFPPNATVGRTKSAKLAEEMGSLLAEEIKALGFNVDFAPVLDINSNPNNPVIGNRSFGATDDLVTKLGMAEMKGMRDAGIVSVVKHFPGHGDTGVDSHLDLPVLKKTTEQLRKLEWIPFEEAVKQKADAVMVAHILFPLIDPNAPASFSKIIIGDQLRGTLGYQGVVITDDLTMGAIAKHYDLAKVVVDTVRAGSDILLAGHGYDTEKAVRQTLMKAVQNGDLTEKRIDESVYRILSLKAKYDLTDKAVPVPKVSDLNDRIRAWREAVNAAAK